MKGKNGKREGQRDDNSLNKGFSFTEWNKAIAGFLCNFLNGWKEHTNVKTDCNGKWEWQKHGDLCRGFSSKTRESGWSLGQDDNSGGDENLVRFWMYVWRHN